MIEEKKLNSFILKRFVITLLCISIAQVLSNYIFMRFLNPLLSQFVGIDHLFENVSVAESILILFELILAKLTTAAMAQTVAQGLERVFHINNHSLIQPINLAGEAGIGGLVQSLIAFCCLFVIVLLWVLPYLVGGISFAVAVSKRVKQLEQYRIEKDRETERQKNLLLSDVAHDLKTPITTIAGFSQALAEGNVEEEKKQEYLDAIRAKSMQTVEMVTLLFEYVKLDSTGFQLHRKEEDICELLRSCIAKWYTDFEEKGMELDFDIPEDVILLSIDQIQLERSISNILINALKHNEPGTKIMITLSQQNGWISCRISDDGERIETETAKHLFDPFVQGDKSRTGGKGSGLGLSITRKIVEMHGGRVRLIQYKNPNPYVKTFEVLLRRN